MKNAINILFLLILVLAFNACLKLPNPTEEKPSNPIKFGEIKTDPNFNWATTKSIDIDVFGLPTRTPIINTFRLSTKDKTSVFYQGNHKMSDNFSFKITVPTQLDSVLMEYGTIEKVYSITGSKLTMDYIINYPEE
jgi:hypothetical protein